ncbi:MAG: fibronectin type III domain-containing protein, partial [Candidatus Fermentibacteraceae bacterium]|nr:fibronectin type III domain-containing protein [Candidatus Fermentibacteraceae bacterium]
MKYAALAAAVLIVMVGCSTEPASPSGTLPVVQNLTVNETESKGDTVVLHWDPLDVEVDGYHVYWSSTSPGTWHENVTTDTTLTEIAESTRYYFVKASKGVDYSSDNSNEVDTQAALIIGPFDMRIDSPT